MKYNIELMQRALEHAAYAEMMEKIALSLLYWAKGQNRTCEIAEWWVLEQEGLTRSKG